MRCGTCNRRTRGVGSTRECLLCWQLRHRLREGVYGTRQPADGAVPDPTFGGAAPPQNGPRQTGYKIGYWLGKTLRGYVSWFTREDGKGD